MKMKKIVVILLTIVTLLTFSGCSKKVNRIYTDGCSMILILREDGSFTIADVDGDTVYSELYGTYKYSGNKLKTVSSIIDGEKHDEDVHGPAEMEFKIKGDKVSFENEAIFFKLSGGVEGTFKNGENVITLSKNGTATVTENGEKINCIYIYDEEYDDDIIFVSYDDKTVTPVGEGEVTEDGIEIKTETENILYK